MTTKSKVKLVLKGILLYTTFIVCMLSIGGIDSLFSNGYLTIDIIVCLGLIYICYRTISKEEFDILFLNRYIGDK